MENRWTRALVSSNYSHSNRSWLGTNAPRDQGLALQIGWIALLAIAFALALDAFAVATVAGLTIGRLTRRHVFRLSFHFGFFQAAMLCAGWLLGTSLQRLIASFDHWIALALLGVVGFNIIRNALAAESGERRLVDPTRGWDLVLLSVATSLDALAVGLSLAVVRTPIAFPAFVVGVIAAALTITGMLLGGKIGAMWGRRCEIFGGVVLIVIGMRILWEHLR